MDKKEQKFVCYSSNGRKLGILTLKLNSDDLRQLFMDNKEIIKSKYPGTAFIKRKRR